MHDVIFIQFLKGLQQLPENDQRLRLSQIFLLLEQRFKGTTVAVLIDEVEVVGSFEGLDEANNILVLEGTENIDFIDG
jgi:hypothetical protein